MFNWFKPKKGSGGLPDPRPQEEKDKDFRAEELAAAGPVNWVEKSPEQWRKFPIFDQDGSSSCVAQATSKILGIENYLEEGKFVELSAKDIYSRRANKPGLGMWGADVCNIAIKSGATVRSLMPSDGLNEDQMNSTSERTTSTDRIGQIYKAKNWIALPFDINRIASTIAEGHGVLLFFRWHVTEWDQPDPTIYGTYAPDHHAIAGVDYCIRNGKKGIVIDDSWGKNRGINGQRFVSEDWFNSSRITWASYFEDLSNVATENANLDKPKYVFTKDLKMGDQNPDVAMLQRCLGYLKDANGYLFPLSQSPTGYYGGITRDAVKRYQALKKLIITGVFDAQTRSAINIEFN